MRVCVSGSPWIVDEEEPQPLPNLDYKIMQGNSLLERFDDIDLSRLVSADETDADNFMITEQRQLGFGEGLARIEQPQLTLTVFDSASKAELQKLIEIYFDPEEHERKTGEKFDKAELKIQINNMVDGKIHAHIFAERKRLEAEVKKYEKKWIDAGYSDFSLLSQNSKEFKAYLAFKRQYERAGETEQRLIELQETTDRPYFLWHLWFKDIFDNKGFDIFIGNPPYIQLQKLGVEATEYEKAGFQTFARTGDIYCLFYELGQKLLKPKGILCFITSNKWMRAGYGESTRKFFSEETNPILLIDFAGQKIFESATVDTNILLFSNEKNQQKTLACVAKEKVLNNLSLFVRQNAKVSGFTTSDSWVVLVMHPVNQAARLRVARRFSKCSSSNAFGVL
ncbi:MAG: Eco57I restriction-modification methylase domain-containing protein [Pyrinomonadaceae bacterium]